jgi:Domain of unknown function (DUF4198)
MLRSSSTRAIVSANGFLSVAALPTTPGERPQLSASLFGAGSYQPIIVAFMRRRPQLKLIASIFASLWHADGRSLPNSNASQKGRFCGELRDPRTAYKFYDKYTIDTVAVFVVTLAASFITAPAQAHFQELIPCADISQTTGETSTLDVVFTHPFEGGPVMDMGPPVQFGVLAEGKKQDLKSSLTPHPAGKNAYQANFTARAPGDYVFYIEPAPYWEPAEKKIIVHYTKVVVDAFGAEEGWDAMVGLPVETSRWFARSACGGETSFAVSSDATARRFRSPMSRSSGATTGR